MVRNMQTAQQIKERRRERGRGSAKGGGARRECEAEGWWEERERGRGRGRGTAPELLHAELLPPLGFLVGQDAGHVLGKVGAPHNGKLRQR